MSTNVSLFSKSTATLMMGNATSANPQRDTAVVLGVLLDLLDEVGDVLHAVEVGFADDEVAAAHLVDVGERFRGAGAVVDQRRPLGQVSAVVEAPRHQAARGERAQP